MKQFSKILFTSCLCALLTFASLLATEDEAKEAAKKIRQQLKTLGFQVRNTYMTGVLDDGESVVFSRTFYQDNEYVLVVSGDSHAEDFDLYVFDDDGRLVSQDQEASPSAVATFQSEYTGTYYIKLVLYDANSDNVHWAFQYGYR